MYFLTDEAERGPCDHFERIRSEATGPLNTLQTVFGSWMGNRMTPSNSSESIS